MLACLIGYLGDFDLAEDRALLDPALQIQPTARGSRALQAAIAYREALALARTVPERRFLERRIAET